MPERMLVSFRYGTSPALFLAAMLSKSSVVMFPVVLLLYGWWRTDHAGGYDGKCSVFCCFAGSGAGDGPVQIHRAIGDLVILQGGILSRVAVAGLAIKFYSLKSIFPMGAAGLSAVECRSA